MRTYYNLPVEQRPLQSLVDLFNSDEALWQKLETHRQMRRKLFKKLTKKQHKALNLLEFTATRPLDDCIGF